MSSHNDAHDAARAATGLRARLGEAGWTRTRAVLSLGMVLGLGAVGTMAAWTDSATATTGVFSTSSMQLKVDGKTTDHQFAALDRQFENVGQTFAGVITVENAGTTEFTWEVTPGVVDDAGYEGLATNMNVEVYPGGLNGSGDGCAGTTEITGARTLAAEASEQVCVKIGLTDYGEADRFKIGTLGLNFVATES